MVRLDLTALRPGGQHLTLRPSAEALELDPAVFEDIRVELTLDYYDGRLLVHLWAGATATLECDRTLELFKQAIEGSYTLFYAPPGTAIARADVEEVRELRPSDRYVDLTDVVRDTLLLAIPLRKVKPGAEALPLPTQFGAAETSPEEALPMDPRWEVLRRLRNC
ncbi:YceD family protein [Rhodothermus bifroesti]|uniref:DUF177 domain-containing protein n=1 Tax=Rhodothermus marinus TaxID=29549 RepID=A0A7V2F6U5_RHOMR|nr:DUF177 domain-containing protein [Rhodothermus bifroesti]GBD02522.1 hypothetical protein HRbin18_02268 [bacterium HR18]